MTTRVLRDLLPSRPIDILDIGGGPGRYAIALAKLGHRVTLLDFSKASLDYARVKAKEAAAELAGYVHGNAMNLERFKEGSFSLVLLLGPLYHLLSEKERWQAIREAKHVLTPRGIILASFITRYAHSDRLRRTTPSGCVIIGNYWGQVSSSLQWYRKQLIELSRPLT